MSMSNSNDNSNENNERKDRQHIANEKREFNSEFLPEIIEYEVSISYDRARKEGVWTYTWINAMPRGYLWIFSVSKSK